MDRLIARLLLPAENPSRVVVHLSVRHLGQCELDTVRTAGVRFSRRTGDEIGNSDKGVFGSLEIPVRSKL